MKKTMMILSTTLSILLLNGCGGSEGQTTELKLQPHKKEIRELKDWTWNVDTEITKKGKSIKIETHYYDNIPSKIKHYQFFIDSKPNSGFNGSDGWEIYGADYLIEDDKLFKSLSDTEWKWEKVGTVIYNDNKKSGDERVITMQTDELQLDTDVNIYIEPYDTNWIGEYFTIPLPDIKVKTEHINVGKKVTREELDKMIANYEDYSKVDVSKITDMSLLFFSKNVKYDISSWNVSNVTNMDRMFAYSKSFNQPIGNWDTSNVTNMSSVFLGAETFNQPLNNWNTSKVTNMKRIFDHAKAFNQPLNNWDVSNVTNMDGAFGFALVFNQPLNWNTSNVTDMGYMFYKANAFNQPLNWNTSKVVKMHSMFAYTKLFNQDISNWDVSNVTDMEMMFSGSVSFNQPLKKWDVSSVVSVYRMFSGAKAFNQDISTWNVTNIKNNKNFSRDCPLKEEYKPHFLK